MESLAAARAGARVWHVEGEWDRLAMLWLLREAERSDIVVAVPGAGTFKADWIGAYAGKSVTAVYDADEAGDKGGIKAESKLVAVAKQLRFVQWPDSSPPGWDLRDFIVARSESGEGWAEAALEELEALSRAHPRRHEAGGEGAGDDEEDPSGQLPPGLPPLQEGMTFDELAACFDERLLLTPDMRDALKVMCAVALSTDVRTDPLWVYIVGTPGAGKTMMLQAFQGSTRCVFRSTVTAHGLVSGWKEGDPSLIPLLSGKSFVLKDMTEVLSMPPMERDQIFATLRGAFDGSVDKSFGNGVHRVYNRLCEPPFERFSMLAGVTHGGDQLRGPREHRRGAQEGGRAAVGRRVVPPSGDRRGRAAEVVARAGAAAQRARRSRRVHARAGQPRLAGRRGDVPPHAGGRDATHQAAGTARQVRRADRRGERGRRRGV
jgi:hypothetical protein